MIRPGCGFLMLLASLVVAPESSSQDVNDDGLFDCADVELFEDAFRSQSQDPIFDVDQDGFITRSDLTTAIGATGHILGDSNLDGKVDRLDLHTLGLNWQYPATSYCQSDFNGDGFVNATDIAEVGINWQAGHLTVGGNMPPADVNLVASPSHLDAWKAGEFVFAESGPFELVAIPQRAPAGLLATSVAVRTKDPTHKIVTFDAVEITGQVHQAFGFFSSQSRWGVTLDPRALGIDNGGSWNQADTQLLIRQEMVGGGAGGAVAGTEESNDGSDPVNLQPASEWLTAGIGPTKAGRPTDGFFLWKDHQANYVEFARIVTPAEPTNESDGVFLQLGVQAGDGNRNPLPFHDVIGLEEPLRIPFFAQPCDFNSDGFCDQQDLDRLSAAAGTTDASLNLDNSEPPLITEADIEAWHNLSDPIPGDTDYDGDVDSADLNNLAGNWQINANPRNGLLKLTSWEGGDLNVDGHVDAADLNLLGQNWLRGVEPAGAPVPEPTGFVIFAMGFWTIGRRVYRSRYRLNIGHGQ